MQKEWYVVNTYSGHENKVKEKLEMRARSDEAWFIVRNTPGVTGFIGSSGKGAKPFPLTPQEADKILNQMGMSRLEVDTDLNLGDSVKVIGGPFAGMFGKIKNIDATTGTLEVSLDLFGQETNVELELSQIEKS